MKSIKEELNNEINELVKANTSLLEGQESLRKIIKEQNLALQQCESRIDTQRGTIMELQDEVQKLTSDLAKSNKRAEEYKKVAIQLATQILNTLNL